MASAAIKHNFLNSVDWGTPLPPVVVGCVEAGYNAFNAVSAGQASFSAVEARLEGFSAVDAGSDDCPKSEKE